MTEENKEIHCKNTSEASTYKIFLSGPMIDDDYTNFHKAEKYALSEYRLTELNKISDDVKLEVLNPALGKGSENYSHQNSTWLRAALNSLSYADEVWFLPGWRNARGSVVECTVAMTLRLPLYEWNLESSPVLMNIDEEFDQEFFNDHVIQLLKNQDEFFKKN